jgi:hypothetical protein
MNSTAQILPANHSRASIPPTSGKLQNQSLPTQTGKRTLMPLTNTTLPPIFNYTADDVQKGGGGKGGGGKGGGGKKGGKKSGGAKSGSTSNQGNQTPCATTPTEAALNYFNSQLSRIQFPAFPSFSIGQTVEANGCKFSYNLNGEKQAVCNTGLVYTQNKNGDITVKLDNFDYKKNQAGDISVLYNTTTVYAKNTTGAPVVFNQKLPTICPSNNAGQTKHGGLSARQFLQTTGLALTMAAALAI